MADAYLVDFCAQVNSNDHEEVMKLNWEEAPDKYWHCHVSGFGTNRQRVRAVVNDLEKEVLKRQILDPWHDGNAFYVGGTIIRERDSVDEIRIVQTSMPKQYYAEAHNSRMRSAGIGDLATDRRYLPFDKGQDHTHDLLFSGFGNSAPAPEIELLLRVCSRLPDAARALASRRKGKMPFKIEDEYDAQDLLHALVRGYFKYSITEEPMGRVGAGQSSRADLAMEELGVLIEVKYVRGPKDQSRIVEELAHDLLLYSKWAPLETFIYLVVNGRDLRDPEALERLSGANEVCGKRYQTHVVLA